LKCPRFSLNQSCPSRSFIECNANGEVHSLCVDNSPSSVPNSHRIETRRFLESRRLKNGTISTMIGKLTALEFMWGAERKKNALSLDTFLSPPNHTKLRSFFRDMSLNEISGTIPTHVGLLTNLRNLYDVFSRTAFASQNHLCICNLYCELCSHASDNFLIGTIPTEFCTLPKFQTM
jgi:hypothetical protein